MAIPDSHDKIIWLHQQAPGKPALGQPCNGCGTCCATEPCPMAIVFLWQRRGRCRALEWDEAVSLYRCGMLRRPEYYVRTLPHFFRHIMRRLVKRWIAADTACDTPDEENNA